MRLRKGVVLEWSARIEGRASLRRLTRFANKPDKWHSDRRVCGGSAYRERTHGKREVHSGFPPSSTQRSDLDGQIIPEPRSDAPVLWTWRRLLERTRLIWQRR